MKNTLILFGPQGGSTEYVAKKMQEIIGIDKCDIVAGRNVSAGDLEKYNNLIFGIATVGTETWQSKPVASGWMYFTKTLEESNLDGKTVALFGLGDQIRYSNNFVDTMGDLYEILKNRDVRIVGGVDPAGYEFRDSKALVDGKFVGLPIDEDFESERTHARIQNWLSGILPEFRT
ncbi:MAG: flavodoxin [Bacteroidia bacterium]|nr:MAG: flavodoxin [Bacteroidia bacterium]